MSKWAARRAEELKEEIAEEKKISIRDHGELDPNWAYLQQRLRDTTKCKIQIEPTGGGGAKIMLQAFTEHELESVIEKLAS